MTEAKDNAIVEHIKMAIGCTNDEQCSSNGNPYRCYDCTEKARAAIAALRAAGLVIVPREPSEAMIDACHTVTVFEDDGLSAQDYQDQPERAWRAMIDSALAEETK